MSHNTHYQDCWTLYAVLVTFDRYACKPFPDKLRNEMNVKMHFV